MSHNISIQANGLLRRDSDTLEKGETVSDLSALVIKASDIVACLIQQTLSSSIRELYGDLHDAALRYGFLEASGDGPTMQLSAAGPKFSSKIRSLPGVRRIDPEVTYAPCRTVIAGNAYSFGGSSNLSIHRANDMLMPWSCAIGIIVAIGCLIVHFNCNQAALNITVGVTVLFGIITFFWLATWCITELLVLLAAEPLRLLLGNLYLQRRITLEVLRWMQEVDVTLKALLKDTSFGHMNDSNYLRNITEDTGPMEGSPKSPNISHNTEKAVETIADTSVSTQKHTGSPKQEPQLPLLGERLRRRVFQILKWQQDIINLMYEDLLRPEISNHQLYRGIYAEGPLRFKHNIYLIGSQVTLRILRDAASRSWECHSQLCVGFQLTIRQILVGLDTRVRRRIPELIKEIAGRGQEQQCSRRAFHRSSNYILRRKSFTLKQECIHYGKCSLGEELAEAQEWTRKPPSSNLEVEGVAKHANAKTTKINNIPFDKHPFSLQRQSDEAIVLRPRKWVFVATLSDYIYLGLRFLVRAILYAIWAAKTATDRMPAVYWLVKELWRVRCSLIIASRVASDSASLIQRSLEEEWACCSIAVPMPRCLFKACGNQCVGKETEFIGNQLLRVKSKFEMALPCKTTAASQSPEASSRTDSSAACRRIALSSISRHAAASLALLRLPVASCWLSAACDHRERNLLSTVWKFIRSIGEFIRRMLFNYSILSRIYFSFTSSCEKIQFEVTEAPTAFPGMMTDSELIAILRFVLGHLRQAVDEGQMLEAAILQPRDACESPECITQPEISLKGTHVTQMKHINDPLDCASNLQMPISMVPVDSYLEVYTTTGEDSSSKKQRYKESAEIVTLFADADPAIQERSQLTLRELKVRLLQQQRQRQTAPMRVKMLALSPEQGPLNVLIKDTCDHSRELFVVTRNSSTVVQESCGVDATGDHMLPSEQDMERESVGLHKGVWGVDSVDPGQGESELMDALVPHAKKGDEESTTTDAAVPRCTNFETVSGQYLTSNPNETPLGVASSAGLVWHEAESFGFRNFRRHRRRGTEPTVVGSEEEGASLGLMSQLQDVLMDKRKRNVGPEVGPSSTAASRVSHGRTQPAATSKTGSLAADDEWETCDILEGFGVGEAPVWVAAADTKDSQSETGDSPID